MLTSLLGHPAGRHDLKKRFTTELRAIAERLQLAAHPTARSAPAAATEQAPSSRSKDGRRSATATTTDWESLTREELIQFILDKVRTRAYALQSESELRTSLETDDIFECLIAGHMLILENNLLLGPPAHRTCIGTREQVDRGRVGPAAHSGSAQQ